MERKPYPYFFNNRQGYSFLSIGRREIVKYVQFSLLDSNGAYNLGFGDLLPDGRIDDKANSNNGDIIRVLSTIIEIIRDFLYRYPNAKIFFKGSTPGRTAFYHRIIKMYSSKFARYYDVTGLKKIGSRVVESRFDLSYRGEYHAFIIKRKN